MTWNELITGGKLYHLHVPPNRMLYAPTSKQSPQLPSCHKGNANDRKADMDFLNRKHHDKLFLCLLEKPITSLAESDDIHFY
jgi:hypothetical protein